MHSQIQRCTGGGDAGHVGLKKNVTYKGLGGRGFANGPEGKSTPEFDTCVDLEKRLCTSEIEIAGFMRPLAE